MLSVSLRTEVQKVVAGQWSEFAQRHPRLAAAIDQTLLVEQATATLADDPEFRDAIETATMANPTARSIIGVIEQFVVDWLRRLA